MIVVVAGLKRSGSTWMFNVARVAMERSGVAFEIGEYDLYRARNGTGLLIKSHWWHGNLASDADVILSSERNIEQVHESLTRFWGRTPTGAEIAKIVEHHRRWHKVATVRMEYRDLIHRPEREATRIVRALDLDVDPVAVLREVETIAMPKEGQDPVTLYFSNHRTST